MIDQNSTPSGRTEEADTDSTNLVDVTCARAQGFGDEYQFLGKPKEVKRMIGNAIPVGIGRFLGNQVTAALEGSAAA